MQDSNSSPISRKWASSQFILIYKVIIHTQQKDYILLLYTRALCDTHVVMKTLSKRIHICTSETGSKSTVTKLVTAETLQQQFILLSSFNSNKLQQIWKYTNKKREKKDSFRFSYMIYIFLIWPVNNKIYEIVVYKNL